MRGGTKTGAKIAARHEARLLWAGNPGLYALLQAARHTAPIQRFPRLGWVVTDPLLARRVLNDAAHFGMTGEGGVGHLWSQLFGEEMAQFFGGPRHAEVRARARDLFTEDGAAALVERSQGAHYRALAERLARGEVVDVADSTRVLAGRMVADLLGLRLEEGAGDEAYRELFSAGERLAALAMGTTASTVLPAGVLHRARAIVADITRGVAEGYRTAGADTILGRCRQMGLGLPMTRALATLLAIAGTETGASGTSRTVALLHDTGQQAALLADPSLLPNAVREGLRVATPAPVIGRSVRRDATVAGRLLRAGERVLVLTYLADNGAGPFDIHRPYVPETRQLWFGAGRHLCLGAAVARTQVARMLQTLTASGPYRIVARRPARRVLVPTYASLLVQAA
ncbi:MULTISPECIES: cytochrome P450 [Thermomonospora]|uniref:Cytochrome P450-like protein n=1 Tax=Thermomonospora curvata (strain ATCC 19995 / DSM 43183 / JCM 3096 / KCTC 9072 / NBRC 15933 / NCIMB 10081 / Henssen B9) TaxID=471852 RepID=D1ACC8_THECD|nr:MULTISPECIES: cytochrome P450 [Thermomonospora]ACY99187.1 Cytochrome P450-like protein [Thermomonospora curvata DSM 43183]PKK13358.1 MAG: cytochrome P450 [Thermomonospora sp. CIF 1]